MCCLRKLIQPVFPFNTEGLLNLDNDVLVFSGASSEEIAAELIPGVFSLGKARQSHCTSSGLLSSGEGRLLFRLHSNEQGREKETAAAHRWLRHHILHSPLQHHQADDEKKRRGCRQGLPQLLCQTFPYFSIRAYFLILCCEISLMGKSFCFSFEDIAEVSVPRSSTIQILLRNGGWMTLYSHKAEKIRNMIERYCVEAAQGGHEYVRAVADYVTREATLLSFRENDIIRVVKNRNLHLDKGWLYGVLDNGESGIFPCEYVAPLGKQEAKRGQRRELESLVQSKPQQKVRRGQFIEDMASYNSDSHMNGTLDRERENEPPAWIESKMNSFEISSPAIPCAHVPVLNKNTPHFEIWNAVLPSTTTIE
ncbi:hypothetical protein AVEN_259857-1 [Araneus ventricosus]|uniref:SH3 domain-containing protein n=1 Tax=Araneus ventricosus TaxID=182803 RepID=A0A4Y2DT95_ARAVE|nr:hypothetical protein AVEN_259857-1 [Araneus ventricosus]